MKVGKLIKIWQQIVKIRRELDAPDDLPPELITRPPHIVRREHFRRKVTRLARLERQFEDTFVAGIEQHKRSK